MAGKSSRHSTIETMEDVRLGLRQLKRTCAHMRRAHAEAGDPPLRRHVAGFEGLAHIVVGQQVSVASATAIWTRLAAGVRPFTADRLAALGDEELKAFGLSRPKIRTLTALAMHAVREPGWYEALAILPDDEVRAQLDAMPGIGPWTADIYIMFCLGRADGFAPGDLALQVAAQRLMGLAGRPPAAELAAIAERWRPWRSVAARMLWAYYAHGKRGASSTPL